MKKSVSITFFWVVVFAINVVAQPRIEQDPNTHREVLRNKSTGKLLIPMEFDDIQPFYWLDSVLVVKKDGLKGAYDPSGKLLVPIQYRDILMFRPDNGFAPGYVMVTSEPAGKRKYGLYRLGEGLVLPEKYETIAPVFTDLFSGRVYMDTVIQFFSAEGKPLYSLPGLAVKNTIAGKVMAIEKRNHDLMFVDKTGKPILPESIKQPRWTDGRYVINGQDGRMNLLSVNGDTVLRQTYHRISALDPDRFVVYTDNYNAGMVDGRGRTIIPIEKQSLYSAYPDTNSVLISRSAKEFNDKIYNRDGKILISGFQYERYQPEKGLVGTVPDQNPEWYYWVKMAGSLKTGLYHWTGRQLVPPEYKYIFYGSDNHVLIAQTFPQAPANKELYGAYNLQGVMVLPAVYTYLRYTRDPNLQIGQHESGEKFGFVSVDKPGDARFEYELITNLYADHFAGKTSKGFVLLDPKGKQVTKDVFATMEHPLFKHVLVFEKQPRGNLVAVATRTGTAKGVWFGLNEKGEKFEFPPFPEEPKEHVQAEESVETVVEAAPMPNENKTAGQGSGPAYETVREKGDTHPAFIGGEQALKKYIDENLRYPPLAKEYAIQGRVVVTFVVETDGSLTNPQIIKDIGAGCGKEALRLVAVMPKWQPGTTGGKPVRAKFTLPVEFKLN